jgi:hypothetical protein
LRDYFSHLTVDKFVRKVSVGEIRIPLIRVEASDAGPPPASMLPTSMSDRLQR